MRIAEIHVYQTDLPVIGKAYRMSGGAHQALDSTIVQVVSDTGVSGWGEVCPSDRRTSRSTPWVRARRSSRWRRTSSAPR